MKPSPSAAQDVTLHHYKRKEERNAGRTEHFCPVCRITIAGHSTSVLLHNQSESHLNIQKQIVTDGKRATLDSTKMTAGQHFARHHQQKKQGSGVSQTIQVQLDQIDQAAMKIQGFSERQDIKPRQQNEHFSIQDLKATAEPNWHSELNEAGDVIFINRKTGVEQSSKPRDWDGHYIPGQTQKKDELWSKTFGDFGKMFCTPMDEIKPVNKNVDIGQEGAIGQWEEVEPEEDYFVKNRAFTIADGGQDQIENSELGKRSRNDLDNQDSEVRDIKAMRKRVEQDRVELYRKEQYGIDEQEVLPKATGFKKRQKK